MREPLGFESFFEENRSKLFGALCLVTGNRQEAEEIAQEAFLKLWERWDRVSMLEDPAGLKRIGTAVLALVAAAVAIGGAIQVFRQAERRTPAGQLPQGSFELAQGWIACGGQPLTAIDPSSSPGSVNEVRLTPAEDNAPVVDTPLAWSRDGSRLLVSRLSRGGPYNYALSADGSEVRLEPVSDSKMNSISPTGTKVVYELDGAIYDVGVDTHAPHLIVRGAPLLPNFFLHPSLSPDGKRIVSMCLSDSRYDVWVMNADGSGRRVIWKNGHLLGDIGPLVWSPDGTRLAIQVYTPNHHFVIDVIGIDGSGLTRVAAHATSPSWSPHGSRIAFIGLQNSHVMTMNADGSDQQDLGVSCSGVAWNPVG